MTTLKKMQIKKPTDQELKLVKLVEDTVGYTFSKKHILVRALTHRSYSNKLKKQGYNYSNERLEFLGDAVLELVVSEYLFNTYKDITEGIMTLVRSTVVKTTSLAEEIAKLDLGKALILGHGEEKTGGREKQYLLANLYEAITGAIYMDGGIKPAKTFIKSTLFSKIDEVVKSEDYIDPKTKFQELAQEVFKITPTYTIIHESGPAHERIYTAVVQIEDRELAEGSGPSKQKAEEGAAQKALELLDKLKKESHAQD